jgi:hypothetical protein
MFLMKSEVRSLRSAMAQTGDVSPIEPLSVSHVPPNQIDAVWPLVVEKIRRGLRHGAGDSTTAEQLRESIRSGDCILWAVTERDEVLAVIVLEIQKYADKRTLAVLLIAGRDFKKWINRVLELIRDLADLTGVDTIEASVRDGLVKWLSPLGWHKKATLMELRR